ncbi:type I-C CRISPR-associated protein Cas5c [Rhodopirellula sallentina]|uniref:type I-C CRISPR-associated protein Cas5c n=1 Tax=Rhodopirellula sallentina TaxID=1263869 RepID=UPI0005C7E5FF|nr:type I-C CRISPR-associated protein Cas5c [Rhodopirellula sallentina]
MFRVRISGPLAIFTRPELKVERISYPVITPSAARGCLEAVFWKPAIAWRIHRISVLNPVHWMPIRRNEVSRRQIAPSESIISDGGRAPSQFADEDRAQRNTIALRDVAYEIEASFEMTKRAGPGEKPQKFVEMFSRRLEKGQHFHQPYLGCRECIADVEPAEADCEPIAEDRDLGLMLYDIDFSRPARRPLFYHAVMKQGVIEVPSMSQVRSQVARNKEVSR